MHDVVFAILEQRLPGQFPATPHQPNQACVADAGLQRLAASAAEGEAHLTLVDEVRMGIAQRGEAVRTVGAHVAVVAHAQERLSEECHHQRNDLVAREARQTKVVADAAPQPRQGLGEGDQAVVLVRAACQARW